MSYVLPWTKCEQNDFWSEIVDSIEYRKIVDSGFKYIVYYNKLGNYYFCYLIGVMPDHDLNKVKEDMDNIINKHHIILNNKDLTNLL